jgi:2-keto-4-pentenoate hydratase/2-oxohepta-3-ene-1,7-dioic acid hydratase in catechol pathway
VELRGDDRPDGVRTTRRALLFIKPPAALKGHRASIPYPTLTDELTYAGEVAAVIDERCWNVSVDEVANVVRGYTIMNDVNALDQESRTARKAFDSSGLLRPVDRDRPRSGRYRHVGRRLW